MNKIVFTLSILALLSFPVWAGPGHDHGPPGDGAGGPLSEIVLTDATIINLGIRTVPAELQDVSKTVDLVANIDYLPERQAIVSARAEGSISRILVKTGQQVKQGDEVIVIQPRLVGNPPVTLRAPIDGYITGQNVIIGQSVTPDQNLLRIADLSEVLVRGQAYEDMAQAGLMAGQNVIVTTASFSGEIFEGTVQRIDASLRPGTRVREIWAVVENPEGKLLANMQARLSVKVGNQSMALVVPQRAILGDMGQYFLYVREGDHFYRRDVTLGGKYGPMREIIEGVLPDEQVVTVGNYQLQFITAPGADGEDDHHGHEH